MSYLLHLHNLKNLCCYYAYTSFSLLRELMIIVHNHKLVFI